MPKHPKDGVKTTFPKDVLEKSFWADHSCCFQYTNKSSIVSGNVCPLPGTFSRILNTNIPACHRHKQRFHFEHSRIHQEEAGGIPSLVALDQPMISLVSPPAVSASAPLATPSSYTASVVSASVVSVLHPSVLTSAPSIPPPFVSAPDPSVSLPSDTASATMEFTSLPVENTVEDQPVVEHLENSLSISSSTGKSIGHWKNISFKTSDHSSHTSQSFLRKERAFLRNIPFFYKIPIEKRDFVCCECEQDQVETMLLTAGFEFVCGHCYYKWHVETGIFYPVRKIECI